MHHAVTGPRLSSCLQGVCCCAGTLHDDFVCLWMQWPVMPWVLADYSSPRLKLDDPATFRDLSRPIGALNAQRLAMYKQRYADMPREEVGCMLLPDKCSRLPKIWTANLQAAAPTCLCVSTPECSARGAECRLHRHLTMQHEMQQLCEMQQAWLASPAIHTSLPCCVQVPVYMLGSRLAGVACRAQTPPSCTAPTTAAPATSCTGWCEQLPRTCCASRMGGSMPRTACSSAWQTAGTA